MSSCFNQHPTLLNRAAEKPLFHLGKLVATPGALDLINRLGLSPFDFLSRHCQGDWGDLDADDIKANQCALRHGLRLLSSYRINAQEKLWIITEADRSVTTLLLPEDF